MWERKRRRSCRRCWLPIALVLLGAFFGRHINIIRTEAFSVSLTTETTPRIVLANKQEEESYGLDTARSNEILWSRSTPILISSSSVSNSNEDKPKTWRNLPIWLSHYESFTNAAQVENEVQWLEYILLENGWSIHDIREVVQALYQVSRGDWPLAAGMVDFLRTLLNLASAEDSQHDAQIFATKPVILACMIHYAECIVSARSGRPESVRRELLDGQERESNIATPVLSASYKPGRPFAFSWEDQEVHAIAQGAARIKQAEVLATAVLGTATTTMTHEQALRLRSLYLSVMDDWRSLVIRCVASLYRLEGILQHDEKGLPSYTTRPPQHLRVAREGLRVHAVLAQRLGMHRLKSTIEERSFRILYSRQYRAVSSFYRASGDTLQAVSLHLLSGITEALNADDALMSQVEDLQVTSRVKEPYSFWKKILKQKTKTFLAEEGMRSIDSSLSSSNIAMTDVHDAVALRVVFKAKKWSSDETDETTRARERLLCYYVQTLLRSKWPALDQSRIKDYILFPKPNGYQSLHHTSSIMSSQGIEFPFEVQVRSQEMHQAAEYGVASHWFYKLGNHSITSSRVVEGNLDDSSMLPTFVEGADNGDSALGDHPNIPYVGALTVARKEMLRQLVHVFLSDSTRKPSQGYLVALPRHACIVDALRAVGHSGPFPLLTRNGETASLDDVLQNGDLLTIP